MKGVEVFRKFFPYLLVDIRRKEFFCSLFPLCLFPIVLLIHFQPNPQLLGIQIPTFFLGFIIFGLVKRYRNRLGKLEESELTRGLYDYAKKSEHKLTENPIRIVDKNDFVAQTRFGKKNKIIFGKKYLNELDPNEKIFVLCHELFHYFEKGESHAWLVRFSVFFLLLYFVFMINVNLLLSLPVILIPFFAGPLLLIWSLTGRSVESLADIQGARNAGKEAAKKPLEKRYDIKKTRLFDVHPKLEIRLKTIEKECP